MPILWISHLIYHQRNQYHFKAKFKDIYFNAPNKQNDIIINKLNYLSCILFD